MSWQPQVPMRRKRGWIRVLVGLALIAAGIVAVVTSVVDIVGERDRIESEAVARGLLGEPLTFAAAEQSDYTVYLLSGAGFVTQTNCVVSLAGGGQTTFSGSNQGVNYEIGSATSVGRFDAGAGDTEIRCEPQAPVEYVVTPGEPAIVRAVLLIVGGAFVILAGIGLLIWGLIGKRVPA
jgi:hypothetical protein